MCVFIYLGMGVAFMDDYIFYYCDFKSDVKGSEKKLNTLS